MNLLYVKNDVRSWKPYCNAQASVFEWDYHLYMKNVFVETCLVYYELVVRISSDIKLTIYLLYIVNFMSEETLKNSIIICTWD